MTLRDAIYKSHLASDQRYGSAEKANTDATEAEYFAPNMAALVPFLVGRMHWGVPKTVAVLIDCGVVTEERAELYLAQMGFDPERDLAIARGA